MTLDQALIEAYSNAPQYHAIFGAILGAVSAVGGLFGRKKKQTEETVTDQTSTSTVDFAKMSADAQAAGFNPLTAMRSGAIGGYVTTHTKGKNVTTSSGGGGGGIGGIADAIGAVGNLFGSFNSPKNDPIKLKSKTTGAVRSVVGAQLGSTRQAGSVVVAPRQTTVRSPVTTYAQAEKANSIRMNNGSFIGPRFPKGAGDNGEIEDAMVAWRRSDGSLMYTYNPKFVDGDAAAAAAIADGANRANDQINGVRYPKTQPPRPSNKDRTYKLPGKFSRGNAAF